MLSCNTALELPRYRDEVDKKPAQWWVAFTLAPSAHPPLPQGALSAGWTDVSPMFEPTAKGADALCVFTTDYGATAHMQSLGAQQGGAHPIITEGLTSRQDVELIAERFDVRHVMVNPSPAGEAEEIVPLGEFLDRLP